MVPESFRRLELHAGSVGIVSLPLEAEVDPTTIRVTGEDQRALPFTLQGGTLRFFAGTPGTVRIAAADREFVYSLTLPEVADSSWTPPAGVRKGIPSRRVAPASSRDLWQWLALCGALLLLFEWMRYGRSTARHLPARIPKLFRMDRIRRRAARPAREAS
jgi:hypothetical protein